MVEPTSMCEMCGTCETVLSRWCWCGWWYGDLVVPGNGGA